VCVCVSLSCVRECAFVYLSGGEAKHSYQTNSISNSSNTK